MSIRRAVQGDADAVADLYIRAREAATAAGSIPPSVHDDEDVRNWIATIVVPKRDAWVAVSGEGTIVGMFVLDGEWLDQLYVDPDLTGRGIGRRLLEVAIKERPKGLRLWTFVSNTRAQRFYERYGFSEVKRTDGNDNEEGAPAIQYERAGS